MRLKIIGIYGVLILALGFAISYGLDLKLSDNQDEAMRQSADRALRLAQSALEAQGLEIVSLAGRAASVPLVGQVLDQWHKATSLDTRERLVRLFLSERVDRDQRELHLRIVTEKGLIAPSEALAAPSASAAPGTPAPATAAPGAGPAATPPAPAAQPAGAKLLPPVGCDPKAETVAGQPVRGKDDLLAKAAPPETKAAAPAQPTPAQPAPAQPAQPAPAQTSPAPPAPAQPAPAQPAPAQPAPAAGATPAEPSLGLTFCVQFPCSDAEITTLYGLPLLNIKTFLTDPKLGYDECRKAYRADLEADQRRIIDEQISAIETRRAAEAAEAARLAGPRGSATPPPPAPPESVPFAPNRKFDLGKYPACATFFQKGQEAITNEVNGKIFATLGWQVAAYAYRQISDLTREKVEFVWFVDQETGRGVAKNNEFSPGTADRYYYQKTIGELFEGLSGATGTKVVQSVRAGNIYRDVWLTREELRDTITGFVHVAMVPVLGPDGNTVGLLAVGVRLENMARIARAARAKMMLVRKVAKSGQETVEIIGDGNDDEKVEALPDGFRKALLLSRDADFRGVAGLDPLAANGKGIRPSRDFEYDGTAYLAQVAGVINASGTITRGDASFSVGPLAIASLVDKTQAMEILSTIWQVWIFAGAAFLLAIVAALILARGFLRPITQIEDGLLRIMNGDWTHRFEVKSAELGGLSYRINQLMAALLGDEEEGEAMEGAEAETDPREAYYQQLYLKFQDAQKQIKQDPASVSYADFRARLMENERKILDKNPGKQVDFDILVQGNQITFKPILK